jgi:KipI family sensor histidine kinase inhibitor
MPITVIGDDLLSVRTDNPESAQRVAEHLRVSSPWREVVAGIESVVVQFDNASLATADAAAIVRRALGSVPDAVADTAGAVEIRVCYGGTAGPDLDAVCAQLGISAAAFIERHTAADHLVDMLGFTPGFAYLSGPDRNLDVPRLAEPRVRVEAGAVGIAGNRTGIYALPGPGGWAIVGRTPERLFDAAAASPFRLAPGMRVRFVSIDAAEFAAACPAT